MLTKPLGAGAISTAAKRGLAPEAAQRAAVEVMTTLNDRASAAARAAGAHALTDVTGFGLLGHLHELAARERRGRRARRGRGPGDRGRPGAARGDEAAVSGGARRNAEWTQDFTHLRPEAVPPDRRRLLSDPMTSGGLLAAVAAGARRRARAAGRSAVWSTDPPGADARYQ